MKKLVISLIVLFLAIIIFTASFYFYSIKKVSKAKTIKITFTILEGTSTNKVIEDLYASKIIDSSLIAKIYVKLNSPKIMAGTYDLTNKMTIEEIFAKFKTGKVINTSLKLTFVEGKRLASYIKVLSEAFGWSEEEIKATLSDKEYLKTLIAKYWFLTDEILSKDIYYPLEGYLFPDTYLFDEKASLKEVVEKILNNTNFKLNTYKEKIKESAYSVHQILTLASMIELEAKSNEDRSDVSIVFYNRLTLKMSLGSDVTTHYAVFKDMNEPLTKNDICNFDNKYNTREKASYCLTYPTFSGLPAGPICNSGLTSIEAALNPTQKDYLYFIADETGKVYFQKSYNEFIKKKLELMK